MLVTALLAAVMLRGRCAGLKNAADFSCATGLTISRLNGLLATTKSSCAVGITFAILLTSPKAVLLAAALRPPTANMLSVPVDL